MAKPEPTEPAAAQKLIERVLHVEKYSQSAQQTSQNYVLAATADKAQQPTPPPEKGETK